jgi:anaerobic dimethyl sulfoxide reductase subunit A
MTETIIPTTGRNNCGGRCRLLVHMEHGQITRITGDPAYPDLTPCIRGLNYHKTFLSPHRLTTPMKRVGPRGEGRFVPISWEEAVDRIASEWVRIRDTYGPAARYVNYGWGIEGTLTGIGLAKRLMRLDGGHLDYYNSYSTACTAYTTPYLYGTDESGSTYDTLLDSKLILLWGHNPAETRFDNLMYYLRKAKAKGTEIVVIDPRKNATAATLNAQWVGLKPSTDGALMDGMAYVIYRENLYDHFFVEERCLGFDRYFDYLVGKTDGVEKTPQWASAITGVPADTMISLARKYASATPAALMQGYGGQRHANGEQFVRGGIMLACLTGNVGVSGGWAAGSAYCHTCRFPQMPSVKNPVSAQIPTYLWTDAVARGSELTPADGLKGATKLDSGIKMIVNLAGNCLINQHGDINRTKRILEDESLCEFILCSDLFLTPSAKYADILLPGTSMLECDNLTCPWDQGNFIGFSNQVVPPVGESRFEYDWLRQVAAKLGLEEAFTAGHADYRDWLRDCYEKIRTPEMPDYDTLKQTGIYRYPNSPTVVAFAAQRQGAVPFPTPSGKVEIYSPTLEGLHHPAIPPIPGYVPAKEGPGGDPRYPLQLIGWHTIARCHSIHFNNEELRRRYPQELWIHPQDAAPRGLSTGDLAVVRNDRGRLVVPVYVTEEIVPGATALAQGAWYQPDETGTDWAGSINVLTSLDTTPLAKGNGQHTNLVEVERL